MDQKRTKWRLDGYAWVISKIEECSDLDNMLEIMPMKFERKRTRGKHLTRNHKHCVQNECDFRTIRIRKSILMGQNVNENKAMTKGRHCKERLFSFTSNYTLVGKHVASWVCKRWNLTWTMHIGVSQTLPMGELIVGQLQLGSDQVIELRSFKGKAQSVT